MLRRSLLSLSILCASAAPPPASAEVVQVNLDGIYDLPSVQSVEFDSRNHEFFAVSDNRLMRWRLDTLELLNSVETDTLASDLSMSPSGTLYIAGQRWDPSEVRLLGGSIIGATIDRENDKVEWSRVYRVAGTSSGITQFSSIAFDGTGNVYFASPVVFSVQMLPDDLGKISKGTNIGFFELRCGASSQFSVFEAHGETYYVSSTRDGALLEYGHLASGTRRPPYGECFRVANVFAEGQSLGTYNSVSHQILEIPDPKDPSISTKSILALEPNSSRLYLFAIDLVGGEIRLSRARSSEFDLREISQSTDRPATFRMLTSSSDGSEVYVATPSRNTVLRFAVAEGSLRYRGGFEMERPVQKIEISQDGMYAVIVTGENVYNADQEITIIREPAAIPDFAPLPRSRTSIRMLQEALNAAGYDAGTADGILGARTRAAVQSFLDSGKSEDQADQGYGVRSIINSVLPSALED